MKSDNVSTASLSARRACSDVYLETTTEGKWQHDDYDGTGEGSKKPTTLFFLFLVAQDNDVGIGVCGWLLTAFSWAIIIVTVPFSLFLCFHVIST